MTEIANPGAAPVMAPAAAAPAPQFIMWHGQPWTPQSAEARRTELLADKAYRDAAMRGDAARQQELAGLYMIARWNQSPDPPPATVEDVLARMSKAEAAQAEQMKAWQLNQVAPETEQQRFEFERGEATKTQKEAARRNIERAKRDPDLRNKIIRGDGQARLQWDRWHWIAFAAREIADPA